ncbi:MAG: TonB family protein [Betaproteobacteria bacterium]|nr:TonB family protein [Betaproteobacteria bacterium]
MTGSTSVSWQWSRPRWTCDQGRAWWVEYRVLLGAIAISALVHAWLLSSLAAGGGHSQRGAKVRASLLHLALAPSVANEAPHPVQTESFSAPVAPSAAALPTVDARRSQSVPRDLVVENPPAHPGSITASQSDSIDRDAAYPATGLAITRHVTAERASPASRADPSSHAMPDRMSIRTADQYRVALVSAARHERESIAAALEGRTRVRLSFASGGTLTAANVVASSGSDELDAEALRLFERAQTTLPVPAALLAKQFAIEATVSFERD